MSESRRSSEQPVDLYTKYVTLVNELSGGNKKVTNSGHYDFPQVRIGVLSNANKGIFSVYIQPKLILREGPYLQFDLDKSIADRKFYKFTTRVDRRNRLPLEKILAAEEAKDKVVQSDIDPADIEDFEQVEDAVLGPLTDMLESVQKGYYVGGMGKRRIAMKTQSKVRSLISHLRDKGQL